MTSGVHLLSSSYSGGANGVSSSRETDVDVYARNGHSLFLSVRYWFWRTTGQSHDHLQLAASDPIISGHANMTIAVNLPRWLCISVLVINIYWLGLRNGQWESRQASICTDWPVKEPRFCMNNVTSNQTVTSLDFYRVLASRAVIHVSAAWRQGKWPPSCCWRGLFLGSDDHSLSWPIQFGGGHQWPAFLGWPVQGVETVASERNCFYGCKGIRRRKRPAIEAV